MSNKARTRRAVPIAHTETVDGVSGHSGRGVAARNRTGCTRSTRLGIDGVRLIHAGVFREIELKPGRSPRQINLDGIGATLDVHRIVDTAAGSSGRGQLVSNRSK